MIHADETVKKANAAQTKIYAEKKHNAPIPKTAGLNFGNGTKAIVPRTIATTRTIDPSILMMWLWVSNNSCLFKL